MPNLFKINSRESMEKNFSNSLKKTSKHYPSSVREWNNSLYVFNKNSINTIPSTTIISTNLIKSYFNLFSNKLERKMRTKRLLLRLRRKSNNRIYLSNCEFKHNNNTVLINIYLFNRQKYNFLLKYKNIFVKKLLKKSNKMNINKKIIMKLKLIHKKSIDFLKKNNNNKLLMKTLSTIQTNENYKINSFVTNNIYKYTNIFYKRLFRKLLRKIRLYYLYKQLIYINKSKSNYTYLYILRKHLENLYNKNVLFNIINLKRFYLNSDILSETIKLKLKRNRRKLLKTLNKMKNKIKIHSFGSNAEIFSSKIYETKKVFINKIKDKDLSNLIIKNLKYKHVTGFRLEVKGRISKRYTASRSMSKLKYNGNLLNLDSSYRGIPSVLLKGNLKSNIQYTKLSSKTRIGSFGVKSWVSGN